MTSNPHLVTCIVDGPSRSTYVLAPTFHMRFQTVAWHDEGEVGWKVCLLSHYGVIV